MKDTAEATGRKFRLEDLLSVQDETQRALRAIAARIRPGMLEEEAYELSKRMLEELGFEKNWHRPYVRFGINTVKMYGSPSKKDVRLAENDIFYLDIGTVRSGHEGDAGDTFLVGENAEMQRCIDDTRKLFGLLQSSWRSDRLTGTQLYELADAEAKRMGWLLNHEWNGHRVSDFPHQLHHKGSLASAGFTPSASLWILEVHLCDPAGRFGAFYEDALR